MNFVCAYKFLEWTFMNLHGIFTSEMTTSYMYGYSKGFFCTLALSLLVKYNISVAQFSDFAFFIIH